MTRIPGLKEFLTMSIDRDTAGEEMTRRLVGRMRLLIDQRYGTPEGREGAWASFQAMAGYWGTEEGLRHPDAYQALAPIVDKLRELMPKRNSTLAGIPAVSPRDLSAFKKIA